MTRKVLVTDYAWPSLEIERDILSEVDAELLVPQDGDEAELVSLAPLADAILTNWKKVPAAALDASPNCIVVSRYGVGIDNIPVERATELGVLVTNVPDFCLEEVSDHAMALLLACARRVTQFDRSTHAGHWDLSLQPRVTACFATRPSASLVSGTSRDGSSKGARFRDACAGPHPRQRTGYEDGVELVGDLGRLLSEADYVSLHAPLTTATKDLIGEPELRRMKSTAYLINTSRGALVNETALVRALREGWIAGAASDVLSAEPPSADHPLLTCENAIITPHAAFYSDTAIAELEAKAANNVAEVLRGRLPVNIVNPTVLDRDNFRFASHAGDLRD